MNTKIIVEVNTNDIEKQIKLLSTLDDLLYNKIIEGWKVKN